MTAAEMRMPAMLPVDESGIVSGDDLRSPQQRFGARVQNKSAATLQAEVMRREQQTLANAFSDLATTDAVPVAAARICSARRKFIVGLGRSAAFATLLRSDLSSGVSNVFLIDGVGLEMSDVLSDVRSTDVLVVFSLRRYRRETIEFGRRFAAAGGDLVVVTDSARAPLAATATALIAVDTDSASFADSPTALAATCLLLSTLVTARAKGAQRRLETRERAFDALGWYAAPAEESASSADEGERS